MKNKKVKKSLFIAFTAAVLIGSISITSGAVLMEPGSEEDPIITLSYVEKRLEQLKLFVRSQVLVLKKLKNSLSQYQSQLKIALQKLKLMRSRKNLKMQVLKSL